MPATDPTLHKFFEGKPRLVGKVGAGGVATTIATTIPHTFVGLTDGNAYIVTVNRTDSTGTIKNPAASTETFVGVKNGTNFITCVRQVEGTAQAWGADTVLEILVTAYAWNKFVEGVELEHNTTGTHKNTIVALLAGAQTFTGIKTFTTGLAKIADIIDTVQALKVLVFAGVSSAVNWIKMTSAATGNGPTVEPDGSDTNIQLEVKGKGTKGVRVQDIVPKVSALTDGANIATNAALGNIFTVTLGGNRTMDAPTNPTDGQAVEYQIKQDGTGSRTISWSSAAGGFDFGTTGAPTLTTTAAKVDRVGFRYDVTANKWRYSGSQLGFA